MAVTVLSVRKAVNIGWDKDAVGNPSAERVDIHTRNPVTDDRSSMLDQPNDGEAVLTYPMDFTGTSQVIVVPAGTTPPEAGTIDPGNGDSGEVGI